MARRGIGINGFALRAIRELSGVNQGTLATRAQCDRTHINHIEAGHYQRVSPELFTRIVRALALEDRRALMVDPHPDDDASVGASEAVA